jgi:hypothetical protein
VGIVDLQMGLYDPTNVSAMIIGGSKKNSSKKVHKKRAKKI